MPGSAEMCIQLLYFIMILDLNSLMYTSLQWKDPITISNTPEANSDLSSLNMAERDHSPVVWKPP